MVLPHEYERGLSFFQQVRRFCQSRTATSRESFRDCSKFSTLFIVRIYVGIIDLSVAGSVKYSKQRIA
jgi:hypothetical protein